MPAPVVVHVYDVTPHQAISHINRGLQALGTGAFHAAVEVYGCEYSFGYTEEGTGVFDCEPMGCDAHRYRESVQMSQTQMSEREVAALVERLSEEWPGVAYDLLRRNCTTFSNTFCVELGVGPIPGWITNLAGAGATIQDGVQFAASKAEAARIVAAAKAGEIDEKYQLRGRAEVKAREFLAKAQELDQRHGISDTAKDVASKAAAKAKELDDKHGISVAAKDAASRAAAKATALLGKLTR